MRVEGLGFRVQGLGFEGVPIFKPFRRVEWRRLFGEFEAQSLEWGSGGRSRLARLRMPDVWGFGFRV